MKNADIFSPQYIRPGMAASFKVALCSPKVETARNATNVRRFIEDFVPKAAAENVDLVVFPEMALTGYMLPEPGQAYRVAETIPGPSVNLLLEAAKKYDCCIIMGMVEADTNRIGFIYNSAVIAGPGGLVGKYRKNSVECHGNYELHKWGFSYGRDIPIFKSERGWNIGIAICRDMWFPEVPRVLAVRGADLIIVPSAAPEGYSPTWTLFNTVRARENAVAVAYTNLAGTYYGMSFFGGRMAVKPSADILLPMEGTSDEDGISIVEFTAEELYAARTANMQLRDRQPSSYGALVEPVRD